MGNKQGKVEKPVFKQNAQSDLNTDSEMAKKLKEVPLVAQYSMEELGKLGALLVEETHAAGTVIVKQGDSGEGFYIIEKGKVEVIRQDGANKEKIADLGSGDYFGELALKSNKARGASVIAVEKTSTFFLARPHFQKLFSAESLNVQFAKRVAVTAGTKAGDGGYKAPAGATKEKSAKEIDQIYEVVKGNLLFVGLDKDVAVKVISEMHLETIKAGQDCIKQNTVGELFYVVKEGSFDIYVNDKEVATRGPNTCFGELALMYNAPRAATVRASMESKVWVIHRSLFRSTVRDVSDQTFKQYGDFLKSVPLLAPLSSYERDRIAEALNVKEIKAGEEIIKQGAAGLSMYIVRKGEVIVYKDDEEVNRSGVGDYFGELALLRADPRAASVKAGVDTTLLEIDKSTFDSLLGPLENILTSKVQSYDTGSRGSTTSTQKEDGKEEDTDIPFDELEVIGTLGKGSFGHVQLVQRKKTNETYALKAVSKQMIVETGQQGHIMSEKNVMVRLRHPFLIRLYKTYNDPDRLYFLLEPVLGGELFSILRAQTLFDESTSRFYAACVLMAFEYMHSFDIVYRDLKPENLLIDEKGFIKITDFGFAKEISSGRTWTLCGTPDYLAPEIVAGKGHGKGVDWWTLGILIYEMLASYPPFYDDDTMKTYQKIMTCDIAFPPHFSRAATSLIKKLLYRRPTRRLGVVKGGAGLIKRHVWFGDHYEKQVDGQSGWDQLYNRTKEAPIIPQISNELDLSNFEDCDPDEPIQKYTPDGTDWDADF